MPALHTQYTREELLEKMRLWMVNKYKDTSHFYEVQGVLFEFISDHFSVEHTSAQSSKIE